MVLTSWHQNDIIVLLRPESASRDLALVEYQSVPVVAYEREVKMSFDSNVNLMVKQRGVKKPNQLSWGKAFVRVPKEPARDP